MIPPAAAGERRRQPAILGYDPPSTTPAGRRSRPQPGVNSPDEVVPGTTWCRRRRHQVDFAAGHVTSERSHVIVAALTACSATGVTAFASTPASVPAPVRRARTSATPSAYHPTISPGSPSCSRSVLQRPNSPRSWTRKPSRPPPPSHRSPPRSGCGAETTPPARLHRPLRRARLSSAVDPCVPRRPLRHRVLDARRHRRLRQRLRRAAWRGAGVARDRDLFLLHVEPTGRRARGAVDEKVASLERWDADIIGPLVAALGDEPFRVPPARPRHAVRGPDPHVGAGAVPALRCDEPGPGGEY